MHLPEMEIRLATEADLSQLVAVSAAADSAAHWTYEQWQEIFQTEIPARLAWIAEELTAQEELAVTHAVGFLVTQIGFPQNDAPDWELENIAVLPEFRRRGLGRELLTALLARARLQGAQRILLEVRESNRGAIHLYEATGFQQLGRRRAYYVNPAEDALIMVHTL
jgi:ribosomal-protein-alanine N-acetyltransferase